MISELYLFKKNLIVYDCDFKVCWLSIWKQDLVYQFSKYTSKPCSLYRG